MLILPIVNRNRVLNVEIKLKKAEKVRKEASFENMPESDIFVNGRTFSSSTYNKNPDSSAIVEFIRNNSIMYKNDYLVTTRESSDSSLYDVYSVASPPKKVANGLDNLYGSIVTDMRKEIPNVKRGRYLSFEKLGVDKHLTDEKIAKLQRIVKEERDQSKWPYLFKEAGISDLPDTIDFINNFDCTVISDTTIPEDVLEDTLYALEPLQTRDYRNLRNYQEIAKSNKKVYSKLSLINQLIYDKPLELIHTSSSKNKQLIKKQNEIKEMDFKDAS